MRWQLSVLVLAVSAGCTLHVASDPRLDDLTVRLGRVEQRLDVADRNFATLSGRDEQFGRALGETRRGLEELRSSGSTEGAVAP